MMTAQPPGESDITITWQHHATDPQSIELVVVLPTFKRPDHLRITLQSVINQTTPKPYAIVVMDNHPEGSQGAVAAEELLKESEVSATIILAHRRGNCAAYNAGFHTALSTYEHARWIQIIDDDEIAHPDWLENQVATAERLGVDFCGAPQHPIFDGGRHQDWQRHPVFEPPFKSSGQVPILYSSGNVLLSTERLREHQHPWLDEVFNFLGGGDSDFFDRCKRRGARFGWCAEAGVDETTPLRRTELSWLNSRSLRNGSISALIQKRAARSMTDHAARIIKSSLLLAASPYRSLTLFVNKRSLIMALNPMNVALGRLLMEFGFANEQYRAADKN
ncbi:MAG: glycosyltransferase [Hyphomicrobiales bacterium]|nr:glycosyltransferase [Hyphomicrobiales bacterium]